MHTPLFFLVSCAPAPRILFYTTMSFRRGYSRPLRRNLLYPMCTKDASSLLCSCLAQYPLGPRGHRWRDNVLANNTTASISHFFELITFIAPCLNRWNFLF